VIKLHFYIRFNTRYGQSLHITGNSDELGNNDPAHALALNYLNEEFWQGTIELDKKTIPANLRYHYFLQKEDGEIIHEWGNDRQCCVPVKGTSEIQLTDTWNHSGEFENA